MANLLQSRKGKNTAPTHAAGGLHPVEQCIQASVEIGDLALHVSAMLGHRLHMFVGLARFR